MSVPSTEDATRAKSGCWRVEEGPTGKTITEITQEQFEETRVLQKLAAAYQARNSNQNLKGRSRAKGLIKHPASEPPVIEKMREVVELAEKLMRGDAERLAADLLDKKAKHACAQEVVSFNAQSAAESLLDLRKEIDGGDTRTSTFSHRAHAAATRASVSAMEEILKAYTEGIERVNEATERLLDEIANNIVRGSGRPGQPSHWLPAVIEAVEQLAMSQADPYRILVVRDTKEKALTMDPANAAQILDVLRGQSTKSSLTYKMARISAEQAAGVVAVRLEQAELASASKPWGTDTGKVYAEIKQESARLQAARGGSLVLTQLQHARRACCDAMLDLPQTEWMTLLSQLQRGHLTDLAKFFILGGLLGDACVVYSAGVPDSDSASGAETASRAEDCGDAVPLNQSDEASGGTAGTSDESDGDSSSQSGESQSDSSRIRPAKLQRQHARSDFTVEPRVHLCRFNTV